MKINHKRTQRKKNKVYNQPNLLQKITHIAEDKEDNEIQCKYGIYCAHLRAQGECIFPHRRNHYLFLNLVPPLACLEDPEEEPDKKMSKKQKKEKKILEKTIKENIDVQTLEKQEKLLIQNERQRVRAEMESNLLQEEKYVLKLVESSNPQNFFELLNSIDRQNFNIFQIQKRAIIQLKKKNSKLYAQIIDKEYRISNRLIKEVIKRKDETISFIYEDINYDTIPSVREYFSAYFDSSKGIPQQTKQNGEKTEKIWVEALLSSLFLKETNAYQYQYYLAVTKKPNFQLIQANIELFNMLIPFRILKCEPFNIFFQINCQNSLNFNEISRYFSSEYMKCLHIKPKPCPDFPFGKMEENMHKFKHWLSKIDQKFMESNKQNNFVIILAEFDSLFCEKALNEIQQQKQKQKQLCLQLICEVMTPIIIVLSQTSQMIQKYLKQILPQSTKRKRQLQLIKY